MTLLNQLLHVRSIKGSSTSIRVWEDPETHEVEFMVNQQGRNKAIQATWPNVEAHVAQLRSLQGSYGGEGHYEPALATVMGKSADMIQALFARARDAFNKGARDGWMRCGTYHIDIDFEGRPSEQDQVNRRWPIAG